MPRSRSGHALAALLVSAAPLSAQSTALDTGTTLVTATRGARPLADTTFVADVIDAEDIQRQSYRTLPQILRDTPGIFVQETAHGQGSPFIRGFTGFRNLLLVDGIRLNNSVFRSGPNQYWNTLDPTSIDRLEVVKGPGSVLWGSDAIGGTVNAITRSPYTYGSGFRTGGAVVYRGSTAERSNQLRVEYGLSQDDRLGALVGLVGKRFGDLHGGEDTGDQPNTGYEEWDGDLKLEYFLSDDTRLILAHQHVDQNDIPRTHRTVFAKSFEGTSIGSDLRRDLDQRRDLSYLQLHSEKDTGLFDQATVSLSWHRQQESRDRIRGSGARELQGFDVRTLGLFAHLSAPTSVGRLTWGIDYYRDHVDSFLNRGAAQTPADDIQGPVADDALYQLYGAFVQDEIQATEDLDIVLGLRFNRADADADQVRDPVTDTRISVEDAWNGVVGSARAIFDLTETAALFGGVSQGFRAPNLSDLTRFDTARTNEFEIPSTDLDPEYYTSYELGIRTNDGSTRAELAAFYTDIRDQIVRFPTGNVNGAGDAEITKDNIGDGYIWGLELTASQALDDHWSVFGFGAYQRGEVDTFPTSAPNIEREYIDRLMPITLQAGLLWEQDDLWGELRTTWADDADRLSTRDKSDTGRIPPGGTPGYFLVNLRGGWQVNPNVAVTLGLENLTDEDYRVHGSGQNGPGLGAVLGLRANL